MAWFRRSTENSQPQRRLRWLVRILVVTGIVIVAVPVLIVIWAVKGHMRIERRLAEIREAGEPTTVEEMTEFYAWPPADEDATQLWIDAGTMFRELAESEAAEDLPIVGRNYPDETPPLPGEPWPGRDSAEALLAEYSEAFDLAHRAAAIGGWARYPRQFELLLETPISFQRETRATCWSLALAAYLDAHRGDARAAFQSLETCHSLAEAWHREPMLVPYLVGIAMHGLTYEATGNLLVRTEFTSAELRTMQETLRNIAAGSHSALRRALAGDRWMVLEQMRQVSIDAENLSPTRRLLVYGSRVEDFNFYLDHMQQLIDAMELPPHETIESFRATDEARWKGSRDHVHRFLHMMSILMAPPGESLAVAYARNIASCRTLDAAIGAELYRRENAELPETLTNLVPDYLSESPTDPFDAQPLRYKRLDDGFAVYSVYENAVDDGGAVLEPPQGDYLDWGFEIRYPEFSLDRP